MGRNSFFFVRSENKRFVLGEKAGWTQPKNAEIPAATPLMRKKREKELREKKRICRHSSNVEHDMWPTAINGTQTERAEEKEIRPPLLFLLEHHVGGCWLVARMDTCPSVSTTWNVVTNEETRSTTTAFQRNFPIFDRRLFWFSLTGKLL